MNDDELVKENGTDNRATTTEIDKFIESSDSNSDDSDWDEIKDASATDFLIEKQIDEKIKPINKKVFEKQPPIFPEKPKITTGSSDNHKITNDQTKVTSKESKYFIAIPTKIRILNPQISNELWKERTSTRQTYPVSRVLRANIAESLKDADWILVGVIVQIAIKTDKNGSKFSIWYLNDLENLDKTLKLMLFRNCHDSLWKEPISTVVAVLRPKLMPKSTTFSDISFTVDDPVQVMVLGLSPDYGLCPGKSHSGENCRNIVNKGSSSMCIYHLQQGYFSAMNRPGFVNLRLETLNKRKRVAEPKAQWVNDEAKKAKLGSGVKINESVIKRHNTNCISLDKLNQTGIAQLATKWGLVDDSNNKNDNKSSQNSKDKTSESLHDTKFTKMLKRPTAGSLNLVKHIIDSSSTDNNSNKSKTNNNNNIKKTIDKSQVLTFSRILQQQSLNNASLLPNTNQKTTPKYIDLGTKMSPSISKINDSINTREELAKLRLAALARESGGFSQLKENNRLDRIRQQVARANASAASITSKAASNGSNTDNNNNSSNKSKKSKEWLELLNQGSANRHLVVEEKAAELDKRLDRMEKIESIETKLIELHEQPCTLYICRQCQTKLTAKSRICVAEGHQIDAIKGFRRFFQCIKCKQRTTTIEKYPDESCSKCGACVYEKTGMLKEREVASEKLLVVGDARRFINN